MKIFSFSDIVFSVIESKTKDIFTYHLGEISTAESLFLYTKGKNHKYYQDNDFVPMFDSPNSNLPPSLSANRIAEVCAGNRFCIYDVQSTGKLSFGKSTKKAYEDYQKAKPALQKGKDKWMHNCSMVPPPPPITKIFRFELVPHALKGVYYRSFLTIDNIFCPLPLYAIILLVPDSDGHKPQRNIGQKNSGGITQQHNKLLSDGPVLSIRGPQTPGTYLSGG